MNRLRRKNIEQVISKVTTVEENIQDIIFELCDVKGEEEEYRDNIPENMQSSECYEKAEAAVNDMESSYDLLEEIQSSLIDVLEQLAAVIE